MPVKFSSKAIVILIFGVLFAACEKNGFRSEGPTTTSLSNVPAVQLNYRYEADVPAPAADPSQAGEERNAAVQADFDATRQFELLDRTLSSPDKKRVAAIYHRISDLPEDYRIDLYTADGKLLKKLTSDSMAVHFPETLRWSPDSSNLAFLAAFRKPSMASLEPQPSPTPTPALPDNTNSAPTDANTEATPTTEATPLAPPTPPPPTGILTFRTEQIYLTNADGTIIRPVTQTEGLKYYYLTWAPNSSMLAAMAATEFEWNGMRVQAERKGEHLIPKGQPRIVEKNGRERRLDDNITDVWPVWSPDSSKVATAFGTQVRIYDAVGMNPTQAPYRPQSDAPFGQGVQETMPDAANTNANANAPAATPSLAEVSTLPDETTLVSFNPIVELVWSADDLLYLKTAYVRHMLNEADSVMSFMRWHRLVLSAQAATPAK
jgi:hypothetical protein